MRILQPSGLEPPTYANGSNGVPLIHNTGFLFIDTFVARNTWATVNVADFAALGDVPADADWVMAHFDILTVSSVAGISEIVIYARKTGETGGTSDWWKVAKQRGHAAVVQSHGGISTHPIPLNPAAGVPQFDIRWGGSNDHVSSVAIMYLAGYGRNP